MWGCNEKVSRGAGMTNAISVKDRLQRIPNDAEEMKKVFNDIFSIECDDTLRFDLNALEVINITEFKEYHGVNVSIMGYLDRTKIPVSIDIGFGDVVYPERMKMEFPVLLDMEVPEVWMRQGREDGEPL